MILVITVAHGSGRGMTKTEVSFVAGAEEVTRPREIPTFVLEPPRPASMGSPIVNVGSEKDGDISYGKGGDMGPDHGDTNTSPQAVYGGDFSEKYDNPAASIQSASALLVSEEKNIQSSFRRYGAESPPEIGARVVLVADLLSGEEFFAKETGRRWPIASVTKLVSAAVTSENLAFNQSTTLQDSDFVDDNFEKKMTVGQRYSIKDLFVSMLLASSNESAEALSRVYGRDNFIKDMNQKAAEWRLKDTNLSDPTGLSSSNQSTAADLAVLALRIYQSYPTVLEVTTRKSSLITDLNSGKRTTVMNINLFAGEPYFLGGKTGYTEEADGNLLSIFSYNKHPLLVVVLGSEDRFGDTEKLFGWFKNNFR